MKTIRAELGSASFGCVALHGPQSTTTKGPKLNAASLGETNPVCTTSENFKDGKSGV